MLGHKTGLNKFKKAEIMKNVFSDHNGKKLESRIVATRVQEEEKGSCYLADIEFQIIMKNFWRSVS